MIVEDNQTQIDVSILTYGNQAAFFKIAQDNSNYTPSIEEPYTTIEFPITFAVGTNIASDNNNELFITEQIKELRRTKFKLASKP